MGSDHAGKAAILVASFGTTHAETRHTTIGAIESDIREAFPSFEVRRAFTSRFIVDRLAKRDGRFIDTEEQALDRLRDEGFTEVVVQPTHLMDGNEYDKIAAAVAVHSQDFRAIALGEPLLSSDADLKAVASALHEELESHDAPDTCMVLVGHGTDAASNRVYAQMQACFADRGISNYLVCTVEGTPDFDDVVREAKERGYRRAVLRIFMVVAGDHALNDMAGDEEDSLKSMLSHAGLSVEVVKGGLGQLVAIDEIYVDHARAAARSIGLDVD